MAMNVENFCNHIAVVGLREFYLSSKLTIRLLWLAFLLGGLGLTSYFMATIINDYRQNPIVTKVYSNVSDKYDFPKTYFSVYLADRYLNRLSKMGLSQEGVTYIKSLHVDQNYQNDTIYEEGKRSFKEFARSYNFSKISDLYFFERIEKNATDDIQIQINGGQVSKVDNPFAMFQKNVLYEIPFQPVNRYNLLNHDLSKYAVTIKLPNTSDFEPSLSVGRDHRVLIPEDFIELNIGYLYKISVINVNNFKPLKTGRFGCTDMQHNDNDHCYFTCVSKSFKNCANCTYVQFDQENIFTDELCTYLKHDLKKCDKEEGQFSSCVVKCGRFCDETIYLFTVNHEPDHKSPNTISISFDLSFVQTGILIYEEVTSYSFVTAVSNVGSQLGLWFGLSVATIVQIVLFFGDNCCKREVFQPKLNEKDAWIKETKK